MSDFTTLARTAASQYGLLTHSQLLAADWTKANIDYRLRTGHLERRHRRVFALGGTPSSWEHDVCAAALAAGPVGAASHRTAARLWGFRSVDSDIDVAVLYPRRLNLAGAVVHRSRDLRTADITWLDGIPVTTPERTICDLGLIFPRREVQRILRHAVATGLVNRYDLRRIRYRNGRQGRNGVGVLGRILDDLPILSEHTESGAEVAFLALCERFDLPTPTLQFPVRVGGRDFRLDFAYPHRKVFVEIDGFDFHSGDNRIANDDGRQNLLVAAGWHPVRFTYAQIRDTPLDCTSVIRSLVL